MKGMKDRVAMVTGSGQGIGAAIARRLCEGGAKVVLNDVDQARASAVEGELRAAGYEVSSFVGDISQTEVADAAIAYAVETFGTFDILVNNAGIAKDAYLTKMTDEMFDDVIRVNLKAQFLLARAATRVMMEKRYGRIVNVASRAWLGGAGQVNYSASKGGVVSLTRTLALESGRYQITTNAVAPGLIDTPLFRALRPDHQERMEKTVPVQRVGKPEEVADAVAFFADDDSGYINGQVLYVCGGRSVGAY